MGASDKSLPTIPVFKVGSDFAFETLERATDRAHAMLDEATAFTPRVALRTGDAISRRWLGLRDRTHREEIDRIAGLIGRPGAYYFNVSYEWGCTTGVATCSRSGTPRLVRVLDWPTGGLGRHVVAAQVQGSAGPWVTLTWPGYTGVLQAMAPGRFAAAINQAPMESPLGLLPLDWAVNRVRVWRTDAPPPARLLRRVFETARNYAEALEQIRDAPIAAPAIFSLVGMAPDETCVIERRVGTAHVIPGPASAANDWQRSGWRGHSRGENSPARREDMAGHAEGAHDTFDWLEPPIRNDFTRLALIAEPATGRLAAQGYEPEGPATRVLRL